MQKMKIYRVENELGYGPYRCPPCHSDWSEDRYTMSSRHPTPWVDAGLADVWETTNRPDWNFGFDSLYQFHNWFDLESHLIALESSGFVLAVYAIWIYAESATIRLFSKNTWQNVLENSA